MKLKTRLSDVPASDSIDCGPEVGVVSYEAMAGEARRVADMTAGECQPQVAALVFAVTGNARALDHYFPLARVLAGAAREAFDEQRRAIAAHPNFDVRLLDERGQGQAAGDPAGARQIVAGHLAETFFYRRDVLDRLLSAPLRVRLYTTPAAFKADGGEAGGSFNPARGMVQLLLRRLYEGFYDEWPGVAPFLHEFGHLLDFFDAATGRMGRSRGLLPGLSPSDGALYTPEARRLFLHGKRLELERYQAVSKRQAGPLPVGHPYVFQNDSEFCAGYFEMFFRNPHYLARLNPNLHAGYAALFGYDPRLCWPQDFPFYIEQNQAFYNSGQKPWKTGITVEKE
jgi:hypothetical protein